MSRLSAVVCVLVLTASVVLSCVRSADGIYVADTDISGWSSHTPVTLSHNNTDTTENLDIAIIARIMPNYRYDRLNLVVETISPEHLSWRDTISLTIPAKADDMLNRNVRYVYRTGVVLSEPGRYKFIINQLTADGSVVGVSGIGIEIVKNDN